MKEGEFRSDFEIGFGSGWQACAAHYERKLAEAQARERKLREEIDIIANNLGEFECAMQTQKLADDLSGHVSQLFVLLALPSDSTELDRLLAEARHELREQNAELQRQLDEAAKQDPVGWRWVVDGVVSNHSYDGIGPEKDIAELAAKHGTIAQLLYARPFLSQSVKEAVMEEREAFDDLIAKINQWREAYPVDAFPEPDFDKAAELLKAGGMTIDAISASNMRHVLKGIGEIIDNAIRARSEK